MSGFETFRTVNSPDFPDGTFFFGYIQQESFDLEIALEHADETVRAIPEGWVGEVVAEAYLGFVEVPSAGKLTIHSMEDHPPVSGFQNPRGLGECVVTDRGQGLAKIYLPGDLYVPAVAVNEVHNVPVIQFTLSEVTSPGATPKVLRNWFGAIVRHGTARNAPR